MWISVLEDEAVLNNLITKYLQKEGYSVRSYLRGEDAVQGLDKPTDLWVIDIMLPDIDGFTVFREVQRKNPNSYVIFISARNQDIDRLAGLELGDYDGYTLVDDATGTNQSVLATLYVGRRGVWDEKQVATYEGCAELWDTLTAGAVSTAAE